MVNKSYMVEKKPPPSGLRRIIDQTVFPAAIDTAASVEMMLERVSVRTREQPVLALGTALTTAFAASFVVRYLLRPRLTLGEIAAGRLARVALRRKGVRQWMAKLS